MNIAIAGLPNSGKTAIFNSAVRNASKGLSYSASHMKSTIGVVKVPDERLQKLASIFRPKKITRAEVNYVDVPRLDDATGQNQGISGEYLNQLQRVDALIIVSRAFDNPSVPIDSSGVDVFRDIETMLYELMFADLGILDQRLMRIENSFKSAKSTDRAKLTREQDLMSRVKKSLENGELIRQQSLSTEDRSRIEGYRFLTNKPVIVVANVDESDMDNTQEIEKRLTSEYKDYDILATALCGKLEAELSEMDLEDENEFRESLGIGESGLNRMMRLSYKALDQLTFFTCGPQEVRAWAVTKGVSASEAAGKIHSDMERGFIRAEVVGYDDMINCGSMAEARKQGRLRQEGKHYIVNEADVMLILFNV